MSFTRYMRSLFVRSPRQACRGAKRPSALQRIVEELENRLVPASHTWSGAMDGLWSNPANWASGGVPANGEGGAIILNFNASSATQLSGNKIQGMIVDIPNLQVDQINITQTGYTFVGVSGGTTLNLTGSTAPAISDTVGGTNFASSLAIVLLGNAQITVGAGYDDINGQISGNGFSLTKSGAGLLSLAGPNSYTGATTISAGTLQAANATSLGNGGNITFTGGTLQFSTASASQDWGARIKNSSSAVNIDTFNSALVFTGAIDNSNTGGLAVSGAGSLKLSGTDTYTGATTISTAGGTTPTVLIADNVSAVSSGNLTFTGGTLRFTANSASLDLSTRFISSTSAIRLDTNGQNVTFSGVIPASNNAGLTKLGSGTLSLAGNTSNLYTGSTTVNAGTLALNNMTAAGGNNNNRIVDTSGLVMNNSGRFLYQGADAAATNSTESIASISGGGGNATVTVAFGGTNLATLTLTGGFTHGATNGSILVNGVNLGKNSTDTSSVGKLIITTAPTLTGTTNALASGINAGVTDTKIVPFLLGEATRSSSGLGTATGTPNTFVTYVAGSGLRPLNPTDEFTNNSIVATKNTYIAAPTSAGTPGAINSLVINGGNLSIDDAVTLTDTSGALLFASNNSIKPTNTTGTLAFGATEAMVTVNSGVTGTIATPITGSAAFTKSGPGTLTLSGNNAFTTSASQLTVEGGGALNLTGTNTFGGTINVGVSSSGNRLNVFNTYTPSANASSLNVGGTISSGIEFGNNNVLITANFKAYSFFLGSASSNNTVTVANNAQYTLNSSGNSTWRIGGQQNIGAGANNNTLLITGTGTYVDRTAAQGSAIQVGDFSDGNSLIVSAGGKVNPKRLTVGGGNGGTSGGKNNSLLVTGPNSTFDNLNYTQFIFSLGGAAGSIGNSVTFADHGVGVNIGSTGNQASRNFSIGQVSGADNNYVLIDGTGSSMTVAMSQPLAIGGLIANSAITDSAASGNHWDVYNGGNLTINAVNSLYVMGVNSALNIGNGTGISTASVGANSGNYTNSVNGNPASPVASGVFLKNPTSRLNFNSGRLTASANGALISGQGAEVLNGTAYVSTAQAGSIISVPMSGTGGLTKEGTGTLLLQNNSTYTGTTTANGGTLSVDFSAGATSTSTTPSNRISSSSTLATTGGMFQVIGRSNGTATAMTNAFWLANSNIINVDSTTGLAPGQTVTSTSPNFPSNAYVISVTGATTFTINVGTPSAEAAVGVTVNATASNFTTSQTVNGLTVAAGASSVSVNANSGNGTVLNLGAITPSGGTVNLTLPSGTQSASNGITTTTSNTVGILGGYATVGNDWATNSGGNIVAFTGYVPVSSSIANDPTANLLITSGGTITPAASGTTSANSLLVPSSAPTPTVYSPGVLDVLRLGTNGGVYVAANSGGLTIGSVGVGTLTAGGVDNTAGTIYVTNNNISASLTVNSAIANNGTGAVSLIVSGASTGSTVFGGTNTYTGSTTVVGGKLVDSGSISTSSGLTVNGATAVFDLGNAHNDSVGAVILDNGGSITGSGGSTLTSSSTIDLRSGTVTANLGGANGLNKTTEGTVTLSGNNSYTGMTTVSSGTLAAGAMDVLADTSTLTVNGATATYSLGANTDTVAGVSLRGNGNITGSGTLISTTDFDMQNGWASVILAGSVNLNKTSAGTVALTGANTYTGTTNVTAGTLVDQGPVGSGGISNSSAVIVNGATAALQMAVTDTVASLVLDGGGSITGFSSLIVQDNNNFDVRSGTISAPLSSSGPSSNVGLTKTTSGTVTLNAFNTYPGTTTVTAGTLAEGALGFISDVSALTVNGATAAFDLGANHSDIVSTVTLQGGGSITGSGTSALTSTGSFEMQSGSVSAILDGGNIALNKTTSGTVTLSGASTYSGATNVNGGKLTLASTGSINSSSGISINGGEFNDNSSTTVTPAVTFTGSGGTLSGSGTIGQAVTVTANNTLSPGNTVGTLSIVGGVTMDASSISTFDITSLAVKDFLNVTGAVNVTSGALFRVPAGLSGGTYSLVGFTSGTPTVSNFTLQLSDGSPAPLGYSLVATGSTIDLVVAAPAPTVTSIAPFVGPTSGGNTVIITGTGFVGVTSVQFVDNTSTAHAASTYTVLSSSQITATAPAGTAGLSPYDVTVTNANGTSSTAGSGNDYTYATPKVTSVVINGGAIYAVDGFGLTPALAGQQSVVEQIQVTFNERVLLDTNIDGTSQAFNIASLAGLVTASVAIPATANVAVIADPVTSTGNVTDGYTQYILRFAPGDSVNVRDNSQNGAQGNIFSTIKDGLYQLNTVGAHVHAGLSDTGSNSSDRFWALYSSVNAQDHTVSTSIGDGTSKLLSDGVALGEMYATFGSFADTAGPPSYNAAYDSNLDGIIDGIDLGKMYANFGTIWTF